MCPVTPILRKKESYKSVTAVPPQENITYVRDRAKVDMRTEWEEFLRWPQVAFRTSERTDTWAGPQSHFQFPTVLAAESLHLNHLN